jgi:hypothetical protein
MPPSLHFITFFTEFLSTDKKTLPKGYYEEYTNAKRIEDANSTARIFQAAGNVAWFAWLSALRSTQGRHSFGQAKRGHVLERFQALPFDDRRNVADAVALASVSDQVRELADRSTTKFRKRPREWT